MARRRCWRANPKDRSRRLDARPLQLDFGQARPLQLDFGQARPEITTGLPALSTRMRRRQGLLPLSHLAAKVWDAKIHASCGQEGEVLQTFLWKQFFSDPIQWWDNRRSKLSPQHPDFRNKKSKVGLWLNNRHKPTWVDSQLAMVDAGMNRLPESLSTSKGGSCSLGEHEGYAAVGMCRKLCEDGRIADAVDSLSVLVQQGCRVDKFLFSRVLKRCRDLVLGCRIHTLAVESGYEGDAFLATDLIGLYASHGQMEDAMRVFTKVTTPDSYNWATIIFAYARHGEAAEAMRLYGEMRQAATVMPDDCVHVAVLKACATARDLVAGKEVHGHILASPVKPNIFVQTGLVDMYSKCGSLKDARTVFDTLPKKNVVMWTAMIAGYVQQGMGYEALSLYSRMQHEVLTPPDSVTFLCLLQACSCVGAGAWYQGKELHAQTEEHGLQNDVAIGGSLVSMYAKCGSLEDARTVFDRLPAKNVFTWTAMIAAYTQQEMGHRALTLYTSMQQEGVTTPNSVTFVCLLHACAIVAALPLGRRLHVQIKEQGLQSDPEVGTALVNMYGKCGSMFDSQLVFESLPERTVEAWGALIGGYTRQGDDEVVFDLLDRMRLEGTQPDGVTFLSVLTVCSHVGLVDKGREYFEAMTADYGITPTVDHYTCMMDILGRAGYLDEALRMAKTMPFLPNSTVWHTLLDACRKWNNVEIGQQAFECAVSMDGQDAASYALMSTIYANSQMWEEAKDLEARRAKSGAMSMPGQSWWADMSGVVHAFVVGDKVNPGRPQGI